MGCFRIVYLLTKTLRCLEIKLQIRPKEIWSCQHFILATGLYKSFVQLDNWHLR